MSEIREMTDAALVDELVALDRAAKDAAKKADAIKAELQGRAIQTMEDKNIRYVRYYGTDGNVSVVDSQSLDVLNMDTLKKILGEGVFRAKVTETIEPKYKYDKQLEKALKAVFTEDYTFEYDMGDFLMYQMHVTDAKKLKTLLKKLKGEFEADRKTLAAVLYPDGDAPDMLEELWYIYRIKNAELIRAFLPEEFIDDAMASLKKAMIVDTKTAIRLDYEKE